MTTRSQPEEVAMNEEAPETQEEVSSDSSEATEWVFDPNEDYSDAEREVLRTMGHKFPGDEAAPQDKPAPEPRPKTTPIPLDAVTVPDDIKPIKGKSVEEVLAGIPEDQRGDVLAIIKGIQASATKANQARAKLAMPAAKYAPKEFDPLDPNSVSAYIEAKISEGVRTALAPIAAEQDRAEIEAEFNAFVAANPLMQDESAVTEVVALMEANPALSMEDALTRVENKRLKAERAAAAREQAAWKKAAVANGGTRRAVVDSDEVDEDGIPIGKVGDKNFDLLAHIMRSGRHG